MHGANKTFRHVQAQVRRSKGPEWKEAWVVHLAPNAARLSMQSFAVLETGERIDVACHGDGSLARFTGVVVAQVGQEFALDIQGAIRFEPSEDASRLRVEATTSTLSDALNESSLAVLDVSRASLGRLIDRPFPVGHRLMASIDTAIGIFTAEVGVVNCRPDGSNTGHFRIGLCFLTVSRLNTAFWLRMLRKRAESPWRAALKGDPD